MFCSDWTVSGLAFIFYTMADDSGQNAQNEGSDSAAGTATGSAGSRVLVSRIISVICICHIFQVQIEE